MVTPAGPISLAEDYLADTLAAVSAFQTLVGAASAAEAKESIYNDALPAPAADGGEYTLAELQDYHPYALVETDPEGGYQMDFASIGGDGTHEYRDSGKLILRIVRLIDTAGEIEDDERTFKNTIGQILDGLWGLAGQAGYLAITAIRVVGWHRFHPNDEPALGDAQGVKVEVHWGTEG